MEQEAVKDFLRQIIAEDVQKGRCAYPVTRFPPEPNGYLHIGHAKSICLNFGVAEEFGGHCHMRFDDTNPAKEDQEYVDSILDDVRWLGFQWSGPVRYASHYFEDLYRFAEDLIQQGLAYVCDLDAETMRIYRGTLTEPGKDSPGRLRSIDENLDLFRRMRKGEFAEGAYTLRARIDMASPNINLRDPVLYRIRHMEHHQTGLAWCIYPSYDFTHPISDALEGITHSICTLEFEDHRPFYDWLIEHIDLEARPRQYEFARLNLSYTLTSKRKLKMLVEQKVVEGWDDPRMPTLAGIRRRGIPAAAIRRFCTMIGVTRSDSVVDATVLDFCVREYLEQHAPRAMAVLRPLRVVIRNWDSEKTQWIDAAVHAQRPELGSRRIAFDHEIWIDRDDFSQDPPKGWKRLVPGGEVRLRHAYVMRCDEVECDAAGQVQTLYCSVDLATLGANPQGRKVKGVIHWVSARYGVDAEVRMYDRLFQAEQPDEGQNVLDALNPDSLEIMQAKVEPELLNLKPEDSVQFEREGYFVADRFLWSQRPVFNRIIALKDRWSKSAS